MEREFVLSCIGRAYDTACAHGFHDVDRSDSHWMMLVLSEVGEMVEADREKNRAERRKFDELSKIVGDVDTRSWCHYFELFVKDTLEDELADVCIRLFDFCGLRRLVPSMSSAGLIDMDADFDYLFGSMSVCEQCYAMCNFVTDVTRYASVDEKQRALGSVLSFAVSFARRHGIDLEWHIKTKMAYNDMRARKHGKEY